MKAKNEGKQQDFLSEIEKTKVLQETKCFDASSNNPNECIPVISKILYLLSQGEILTKPSQPKSFSEPANFTKPNSLRFAKCFTFF